MNFPQIIVKLEMKDYLIYIIEMYDKGTAHFCQAVPVSALPPSALPSALPSGGSAFEIGYSGPWFHLLFDGNFFVKFMWR